MRNLYRKYTLVLFSMLTAASVAFADGGVSSGYSPFSKFGIGKIYDGGTPFSMGMGGVGVATRDHRFINVLNPAAVTARDTLSFMADFSINQSNSYYRQDFYGGKSLNSVNNAFNINNIVLSFPIWRSSAFMVGITPFSSVGYSFADAVTDPSVVGNTGAITDSYEGIGGMYQIYAGAGVTFWKRLSIGGQFDYYFGSLEKSTLRNFASSSYRSIYNGSQMRLKSFSGKVGLQYDQPIKKDHIVIGATYRIASELKGNNYGMVYVTQSEVTDTLRSSTISLDGVNIPSELTVGLSYRYQDKLMLEFNYSRSDWKKSGMDVREGFSNEGFKSGVSQTFKLGAEYIPNKNDIRYYMKRCSYRAGAYYKIDNFTYCGRATACGGITLGITFPVFRWLNGLTVAVDFGQRGSLKGLSQTYSPIRERYVNFGVSFDIYDIWFIKPKYE